MFSSKDLFFTSATSGYQIAKSLRFRSSATAYLNRTPSTTSGSSSQIYTWSGWVKLGYFNVGYLMSATGNSGYRMTGWFLRGLGGNGALEFEHFDGTTTYNLTTSAVFRDPSAWYHIIIAVDSTQATNTNRTKIYVNGVQQTVTGTYLAQNTSTYINTANVQSIGRSNSTSGGSSGYFDGYMAEVNFIDGAAKQPTDFGAFDTNGIWQPITYTGSYGTNGFYLKFTDVGATSGANSGYGKDFAGTNYWTTNNFGTTSTGSSANTYDSMWDSPTNYAGGDYGAGNYSVFNPIDYGLMTLSGGNLNATNTSSANIRNTSGTLPITRKTYVEFTLTAVGNLYATSVFGVVDASIVSGQAVWRNGADDFASTSLGWAFTWQNGGSANKKNNGSSSSYGSGLSVNDVIMMAIDPVGGKIWWGQNGTWFSSGDPAAGTNAAYTNLTNAANLLVAYSVYDSGSCSLNAGQRPYIYAPPYEYSSLNTQNLRDSTIPNGAAYMAASLWNGTAANQPIYNSANNNGSTSFQPDFVWIKTRTNVANDHFLFDVIRANTKTLISNSASAEQTVSGYLNSFNVDGFTVGSNNDTNASGRTFVGWNWKAGGSGSTGSGSGLTSITTSANATAGFSITTYTGNGSAGAYFNHGLGAAPGLVIIKQRTASTTTNWAVWHSSIANTNYLLLNTTAASTSGTTYWNSTSPDSTKVTLGTAADVNTNAGTYVAYCFTPISGYSAIGSLLSNGVSGDGTFIYLGFRPRFVLMKRSNTTGNWYILDTSRNTYNVANTILYPDTNDQDTTLTVMDIVSNGFKIRAGANALNNSGDTLIYAAFAENPLKIARAR